MIIGIDYDEMVDGSFRAVEVRGFPGIGTYVVVERDVDGRPDVELSYRRAVRDARQAIARGLAEDLLMSSECDSFVMDHDGAYRWVEDPEFGELIVTKETWMKKQLEVPPEDLRALVERGVKALEEQNQNIGLHLINRLEGQESALSAVVMQLIDHNEKLERIATVLEAYHREVGRPTYVVNVAHEKDGVAIHAGYSTLGWLRGRFEEFMRSWQQRLTGEGTDDQ